MAPYGERSMPFKTLLTHISLLGIPSSLFILAVKPFLKYYKYMRSIETNKMKSALPPALWNLSICFIFFKEHFTEAVGPHVPLATPIVCPSLFPRGHP